MTLRARAAAWEETAVHKSPTKSRRGLRPGPIHPHRSADHELRRCHQLAKQLAEALEVADLRGLQIVAAGIRERVWAQLAQIADVDEGADG